MLPEHREALETLPARLSEPEALAQLLQSLDEATVYPTEDELGELFRELRPEALDTVFAWLPRITNERVRQLLDHAAQRLAQAYPDYLVKALESDDDEVLLQAMRIAGQLKLPPVVPAIGQILRTRLPEVKRAAVDALTEIGSAGAMQHLEAAIDDADRHVRIAALRVLAHRDHKPALAKIEAAISGKAVRDADLTEKTALFEAYGILAGAAGISRLAPLLQPKGFMKRKEDPEIRACAAMALGKIGTPEARKVLESMTKDKDPLLRNAVNKALREMG
jgi:HEAT repeat protein